MSERLPYEVVRARISEPRDDPHAPGVRWRYDGKWGLQCSGDVLRAFHKDAWSWSGAETFVPTPERITLWYELMREVVYE
jgi:hypothetical protein